MNTTRKAAIIAFILLLSFKGYSLTIYEISYEFKTYTDYPRYTAFLVRYGNGTGFMRIRYYKRDFSETLVVNMDFDEIEGTATIDGLLQKTLKFQGKNPTFMMNTSLIKNQIYNPDLIWFKKSTSQANYVPWGVTSRNSDGKYDQGKITSVKLMNSKDLTSPYVRLYFGENEPFYLSLFAPPANTTYTNVSNTLSPAKLYLITVANTEDASIGTGVKRDIVNVYNELKDVASFLSMPFIYKEISGPNFTKQNVNSVLAGLYPGSNDVVIFYYSGHGFTYDFDPNQAYPQLDFRTNAHFQEVDQYTINASDIYFTIKKKNARLSLIITDCCNASIGAIKPFGKNYPQTAKSVLTWNKSYCYNLFMQSKGCILAAAAQKGQSAYCDASGSYFTSNLMTSMEKYLSKFQLKTPSWEQIVDEAKVSTASLSLTNECKASSCRQDPVCYLEVKNN